MCGYSSGLSQEFFWHCPVLSLVSLFLTTICDMFNSIRIQYFIYLYFTLHRNRNFSLDCVQTLHRSHRLSLPTSELRNTISVRRDSRYWRPGSICHCGWMGIVWVWGGDRGGRGSQERTRQLNNMFVIWIIEIFSLPKISLILSPLEIWSQRAHSIVVCLITHWTVIVPDVTGLMIEWREFDWVIIKCSSDCEV